MVGIGKSIVGKIRKTNEDSILIENGPVGALPNLYIVADGMGGHLAGDVASRMAINDMRDYLEQNSDYDNIFEALTDAVEFANKKIYKSGSSDKERLGMGTTLLAASVSGNMAHIINIGDSRLYTINVNEGRIEQITVDHSYVMELLRQGKITADEAASHPSKNIITRALGIEPNVKCDRFSYEMKEGDILLLCSDGLTNMLSDKDIQLVCVREEIMDGMLEKLLESANEKGGTDNISVILYKQEKNGEKVDK